MLLIPRIGISDILYVAHDETLVFSGRKMQLLVTKLKEYLRYHELYHVISFVFSSFLGIVM